MKRTLAMAFPEEMWQTIHHYVIDQRVESPIMAERVPTRFPPISTSTLDQRYGKRTKFTSWKEVLDMLSVSAKERRTALKNAELVRGGHMFLPVDHQDMFAILQAHPVIARINLRILPGDLSTFPGQITKAAFFKHLTRYYFKPIQHLVMLSNVCHAWANRLKVLWDNLYARLTSICRCCSSRPGAILPSVDKRWVRMSIPSRWYRLQLLRFGVKLGYLVSRVPPVRSLLDPLAVFFGLSDGPKAKLVQQKQTFLAWIQAEIDAIEPAIPQVTGRGVGGRW